MKIRNAKLAGTLRGVMASGAATAASSGATDVVGRPTAHFPPAIRAVTAQRAVPTIAAFTLMEVMIAIAVFCIGVFAILGLVASIMRGARLLDKPMVDAGAVASQISQTNSWAIPIGATITVTSSRKSNRTTCTTPQSR